jgi:hypothetical protein
MGYTQALVLGAFLGACSYPCEVKDELQVEVQEGEAVATMECGAAQASRATLSTTGMRWGRLLGSDHLTMDLLFSSAGEDVELELVIPRELADGTYPANHPLGELPFEREPSFLLEVKGGGEVSGTVSIQRTRDFPFVDVDEPEPGPFRSEVVLKLDLSGKVASNNTCVNFRVAPVTLRLLSDKEVGICETDNARLGH